MIVLHERMGLVQFFKLHWDMFKDELISTIRAVFNSGHNQRNQSHLLPSYPRKITPIPYHITETFHAVLSYLKSYQKYYTTKLWVSCMNMFLAIKMLLFHGGTLMN